MCCRPVNQDNPLFGNMQETICLPTGCSSPAGQPLRRAMQRLSHPLQQLRTETSTAVTAESARLHVCVSLKRQHSPASSARDPDAVMSQLHVNVDIRGVTPSSNSPDRYGTPRTPCAAGPDSVPRDRHPQRPHIPRTSQVWFVSACTL